MSRRLRHWIRSVTVIAVVTGAAAVVSPAAEPPSNSAPPSLLQQALAGPLRDVHEVIFCTRSRYDDGHLNFTRPELSPLLLAPLAKQSGGLESCGAVFRDRTDPDYQALLAGLQTGQSLLDAEPRYGRPGFRPNPQYTREMKKYAILPATFDLTKDRLDVFQTDQSYWKSSWYQPAANAAK